MVEIIVVYTGDTIDIRIPTSGVVPTLMDSLFERPFGCIVAGNNRLKDGWKDETRKKKQ
jgi:hypothetical protein